MPNNDSNYPDIDHELLKKAATQALTRPSDSAFWDDRLYTTHGVTFTWSLGDQVSESNYHVALKAIQKAAGPSASQVVIDATIGDWLTGSVRQIFVQVYTKKGKGNFTKAWIAAVALAFQLQEYPILDEEDYSSRENDRHDRQYEDVLYSAEQNYPDDSDDDRHAIALVLDAEEASPDIDVDHFIRTYSTTRDAYFEKRAAPYLPYSPAHSEIPGQEQLEWS